MLKHLVMWKFNQNFSLEQNKENARQIKEGLESLSDIIPEIKSLKLYIECLSTSDVDVILDSTFACAEDLNIYMTHPEHVKIANKIKMYFQDRLAVDYTI